MIDTWLDDQMIGVTPRYVEPPRTESPARMLTLASCFEASHIIPDLQATTKTGLIVELAELARRLGLVRDETWFVGALIKRENVLPTATGNGLAIMHTLRRSPEQVVRPFMVLGRSREGRDFDALDGQPVHFFFVLGLKYEELHLPWLAKVVRMMAQPGAVDALLAAPDAQALFDALADVERRLEPARAVGS
jgi:PTS system fructose-specific IIC component